MIYAFALFCGKGQMSPYKSIRVARGVQGYSPPARTRGSIRSPSGGSSLREPFDLTYMGTFDGYFLWPDFGVDGGIHKIEANSRKGNYIEISSSSLRGVGVFVSWCIILRRLSVENLCVNR